jgi:hypothetical protein
MLLPDDEVTEPFQKKKKNLNHIASSLWQLLQSAEKKSNSC